MSQGSEAEPARSTSWLSKGLEALEAELLKDPKGPGSSAAPFDVIVVGTGYGGAVVAAELARAQRSDRKLSVCILERGREYLDGAFPTRAADLAGHVRFSSAHDAAPRGVRTGLFDLRAGPDVCALLANGIGGGSLINAGVMLPPDDSVWDKPAWPDDLSAPVMQHWLDLARQRLAPSPRPAQGRTPLTKHGVMQAMGASAGASKSTAAVPQTIAWTDGHVTSGGVERRACVDCGDCFTGCNAGAKVSLDTSLLAEAWRAGFRIVSGAAVGKVFPRANETDPWHVEVWPTDPELRHRRRPGEFKGLYARHVVLAAGTFGSTEILMRSRGRADDDGKAVMHLSRRLGTAFSGNGDLLVAMVDDAQPTGAQPDEGTALRGRNVGPTISTCVDFRANGDDPFVVQDLSAPGALRLLTREAVSLTTGLQRLAEGDTGVHGPRDLDPLADDAGRERRTMLLAVIGHDSADGELRLTGERGRDKRNADGAITVHWPHAKDDPRLVQRTDAIAGWLKNATTTPPLSARLMANPLWRLMPADLEAYLGRARGPLITVHPLGGCPMGRDAASGVVDSHGRVFRARPRRDDGADEDRSVDWHDGLWVVDGSIVPTSLGINPALTIAALALRASQALIESLQLHASEPPVHEAQARPVFRPIDVDEVPPPALPTQVEVIERLTGAVEVAGRPHVAELTLRYQPVDVRRLVSPDPAQRTMSAVPGASRLRVFEQAAWDKIDIEPWKEKHDADAAWIAPVTLGAIRLFERDASTACQRRRRAFLPWLCNRGARDMSQYVVDGFLDWLLERPDLDPQAPTLCDRMRGIWRLLTLAGERRGLHYHLEFGPAQAGSGKPSTGPAAPFAIDGSKWLTYNRRANPWKQLTRLTLTASPFGGSPCLELDRHFLVRRGLPLLRIVQQEDQPTALMDLIAFGLYVLRLVLSMHTWSFRLPDAPVPRPFDRLPGIAQGLPPPQVQEIAVDRRFDVLGPAVSIRLTRYAQPGPKQMGPPVLMIHGYSSSGVAFAHHSVPHGLARHLYERGRDVWIIDLRTSAGMPSASEPWTFEQVGYEDIPLAVDRVVRSTGQAQIDVVAHCMGSAMLHMGLLGAFGDGSQDDPYRRERSLLPQRIRRLVLMQVGPLTLFSEDNVLRAYVMRYVRHYLGLEHYSFRPVGEPGLRDQLIDRLLATLPYPDDEYDRENPLFGRRPWVGTRHRMDALYGRDFALANVPRKVLAHIDDHFGPLNIETVAQAVHFTLHREIADARGERRFVAADRVLQAMKHMRILGVHGKDNGLADARTAELMRGYFQDGLKHPSFELAPIPGYGHQDCLVGEHAARDVFPTISAFLDKP